MMWALPPLSSDKEQWYLEQLQNKIWKEISETKLKDIISPNKLKDLLIARPQKLKKLNTSICNKIKNNQELMDKVRDIFNYTNKISKNKKISWDLAKRIGNNTCVYCNRQYTFTISKENEEGREQYIVRPEFDHYLSQSNYPLLALSLYNLIPSCHICNSICKHQQELQAEYTPYADDIPEEIFNFSYIPSKTGLPQKIILIPRSSKWEKKVHALSNTFHIREIYSKHIPLEIKELYEFAEKHKGTYLTQLREQLGKDFNFSLEDAYRILFGTELLPEKTYNRPLSKLKRDLLREWGINL